MKRIQFTNWIVLLLCIFSFSACKTNKGTTAQVKKTGVKFASSDSLSDALDRAVAEDKLVFLDFYTTWCLPCKLMDEDVFPDRRLGEFMNENFINVKVNAEKGNGVTLANIYAINAYPTLLFLDNKGNILERKIGAAYQREMYALGEAAMNGVQ